MARAEPPRLNIVLGVTGSIAAYKAPDVARRFMEAGASVRAVLTPGAERFITAVTLAGVTGAPAAVDAFDLSQGSMPHLALAKSAAAVVVAPCSADFLSALAAGRTDTLLASLILSTRAPVFLAPAMHDPMWTHPATLRNTKRCRSYGYRFLGPEQGALASGDSGWGRMVSPEDIVHGVMTVLSKHR